MRMNSRQLEKYRAALEGLLSEALPGKVPGELQAEGGRASLQLGPPPTLVLIF